MKKVNWAVMGPGRITEEFIPALLYVEGAHPYAVASRSIDRAKAAQARYGFEKAYGSYAELVADKNIDVIYIATPTACHFENAKLCLENGHNVLCEKSVTLNVDQFNELVEIAKGTNLKLHYSHAIYVGRNSFRDKEELMRIFDQLRAEGVDVMFDIYNECLGVSVITVILPAWYQGMSEAERKKPLNRLKLAVLVKASSLLLGFGFRDIQIAYIGPGYEKYEGKTVHEIAVEEGTSDLKAYLKLCDLSRFVGRVNMGPYSTPEIISEFEHNEHCLYMTDAWVEEHGIQNPAIYDCYPKFLRDSLRGTGDTLPNTIRRMTGAIADRFMLQKRGYLKEGYFADLTVFDEEALKNGVPDQEKPFGIEKVFINGQLVLSDSQLDEAALKQTGRTLPVFN